MSFKSTFEEELNNKGILVYKNKGVSMLPLIHQGRDIIIIEKLNDYKLKKLDVVLFKRYDPNGETLYVLHRIVKVLNDNTYFIVGDNCVYGDVVNGNNIIGLMTSMVRNSKKITINSFWYKVYVNTYCRFYHLRILYLKCLHFTKRVLYKIKCFFTK